jgi:malate dehydrogenase (oxaloacetate-decarboxylating)(NADP+)
MPALHSAHIASNLLKEFSNATKIGPTLNGLCKPVQIAPLNASISEIMNLAALAALEAIENQPKEEKRAAA